MIAEDSLDKHFVKRIEAHAKNPYVRPVVVFNILNFAPIYYFFVNL